MRKNFVDQEERDKHPNLFEENSGLLGGQVGYEFYKFDGQKEVGKERMFFEPQRQPQSPEFVQKATDLGRYLWLAARNITRKKGSASGRRDPASLRRRSIYLATPAPDMFQAHERISKELIRRGFEVVPSEMEGIPLDDSANTFVDETLKRAEVSVHLVGTDEGFAPAGADRILKLQLARAAMKVGAASKEQGKDAGRFHRIIFAPKMVVGADSPPNESNHDPFAALARFDKPLPTDKIVGSTLSAFEDFLYEHLKRIEQLPPPEPLPSTNAKVYLCHSENDSKYAASLAADLQKLERLKIEPLLPVFDGTPTEVEGWHQRNLRQCHIVVICWAKASESWVRAQSNELKNWRGPAEAQKFAFRGLIAGPPKGERKEILLPVPIPPRTEIDKVLDLMEPNRPISESLNEWLHGAATNAP